MATHSAQLPYMGAVSSAGSQRLLLRVALAAYTALCLETIFSVPYRSVYLATHSAALSWAAALAGIAFAALCLRFRESLFGFAQAVFPARVITAPAWSIIWLLIGLLLRLGWALRFPPNLKSDGAAYFADAVSMAHFQSYPGAYWPPGSSLFVAPFLMLFGSHQWVTVLTSLLLFAATYWVTRALAKELAGMAVAGLAGFIIAIWPGYIAVTSINCKECLLAFLLPLAMLLYHRATKSDDTRWPLIAAAGILIGFSALTQPGFLLFPGVIVIFELMKRTRLHQLAGRMIVLGTLMVMTVLPWSYRNYLQFHKFVLISTNGGMVFYTSNNPQANASYWAEGERNLPADGIEADREGYRKGREWIKNNPVAFAILDVRKQVVFLGDDGIGFYETLKRDKEPPRLFYAAVKLAGNLWWLGLFLVLICGAPGMFRRRWMIWFGLCFVPFIYQWAIDGVFESGSRHHMSYVGFIAILVAMVLFSGQGQRRMTEAH